MKNKKYIILFSIIAFIVCLVGAYILSKNYYSSANYMEKNYINDPNDKNLICLLDACIYESNDKYFLYIDKAIEYEKFKSAAMIFYPEYTKDQITEMYNYFVISGLNICSSRNDINKFIEFLDSHFDYVISDNKVALILNNLENQFVIENKMDIICALTKLYYEESNNDSKMDLLACIFAYYNSIYIKDEENCNKFHNLFEGQVHSDSVSRENNQKYVDSYSLYSDFWDKLLNSAT